MLTLILMGVGLWYLRRELERHRRRYCPPHMWHGTGARDILRCFKCGDKTQQFITMGR